MVLALSLFACGTDEPPESLPPVTWEACEDHRLVQTQSFDQDALPDRSSPSKGWPGLAVGDFTGDGVPDVLMAYGGGSALFRGDGTGQLRDDPDVTLDGEPLPRARAVAAADLDSDGDLDAVLSPYDSGDLQILMFNDGQGRFTSRALPESGFITWTTSFGDLDGDGRLDLYLATYDAPHEAEIIMSGEATGTGHAVYLQQPDGSFERQPDALPASVDPAVSLLGQLVDVDADGDLDVYMTNDFGPFVLPNQLLLNDGQGHFTLAPDCDCDVSMYSMGTAVGDPDSDGDPDLYISNVGSPRLLTNLGDGTFYDSTATSGAGIDPAPDNMTSWGTAFFDADQDGCQDLMIIYGGLSSDGQLVMDYESGGEWREEPGQRDALLLGDCQGGFERAPDETFSDDERARAMAVGDLDQDGRPDVVIAGKHFLHVWLTEGGCSPGLTLRLDAGDGNRNGVGARVAVDLGEHTQTQWLMPANTAASSEPALFFGFGGRSRADHVTITWPDGAVDVLDDVAAGTRLALVR